MCDCWGYTMSRCVEAVLLLALLACPSESRHHGRDTLQDKGPSRDIAPLTDIRIRKERVTRDVRSNAVPNVDIDLYGDLCEKYKLTCLVVSTCDGTCTFTWRMNDTDITSSPPPDHSIDGAVMNLTTSHLSTQQSNVHYKCAATDNGGTSVDDASSKVVMSGFTSAPTFQRVFPDQNIILTWDFTAYGCPNPCEAMELFLYDGWDLIYYARETSHDVWDISYGEKYNETSRPVVITKVGTASPSFSAELTIVDIQVIDGEIYAMVFTEKVRPFYHACTKDAILYVYGIPSTPLLDVVDAPENTNATLTCISSLTSMPEAHQPDTDGFIYHWFLDGVEMTASLPSRHIINYNQLHVLAVEPADMENVYTCVSEEVGGLSSEESNSSYINVLHGVIPVQVHPPDAILIEYPGQAAHFYVELAANPFPIIDRNNWQLTPLGGPTQSLPVNADDYLTDQTAHLLVDFVEQNNYGTYTLEVDNFQQNFILQEPGTGIPVEATTQGVIITYLDINITAEKRLLLYADGLYLGSHDDYTRSAYFSAPENTLVYAVEVTPGPAPVYSALRASTSSGEVTDTSWRCTETYFQGWEQVSFDDSGWSEAVVNPNLSPSIPGDIDASAQWIHADNSDSTNYCRKNRRVIYSCDGTNQCQNGGTCLTIINNKQANVRCNCLPVYFGELCEIPATKIVTSSTCGATCQSSSDYDVSTTCTAAIDGSYLAGTDWVTDQEDVGAWISVNFGHFYTVTRVSIMQRCHIGAQSSKIAVSFTAGPPAQHDLICVEVPDGDSCKEILLKLNINPTITDFVRVEVVDVCSSSVGQPTVKSLIKGGLEGLALTTTEYVAPDNTTALHTTDPPTTETHTTEPITLPPEATSVGFNELLAYGLDAALENVASIRCGVSCNASSVYHDVDFACENALDEETDPELGNSWVADHQGPGSWIIVNLPVTQAIVGVGFLQLCSENGQARDVRLEFSDGTSVDVQLDCFSEPLCIGQYWQHFNIPPVSTQYVRVTILSTCTSANSGFREIRVFAYSSSIPEEGRCPVLNV